jgi:hypothetical protein
MRVRHLEREEREKGGSRTLRNDFNSIQRRLPPMDVATRAASRPVAPSVPGESVEGPNVQ